MANEHTEHAGSPEQDGRAAHEPIGDFPHDEAVLVLDFGSQTAQLIARRVREAGVFSVLVDSATPAARIAAMRPAGIILSGGPASVYDAGTPRVDPAILELGVPILGICYGMHLVCGLLGAEVARADRREFGRAQLEIADGSGLFSARRCG